MADRPTSRGLGAVDAEWSRIDQPELGEFGVRLVDLREQRAGGHRNYGVPGNTPAELFANLEAHRLRPLGVIRPQIHVHEAPAVLARDLGAESIHLVVRT